ncbi:MAG: KamA family radical SAM protein [Kiritimatiellae bacterium]|nr:KamA family radical SAM protein [Kiritimatiellia bacterium]
MTESGTDRFRARHFPALADAEWNDWRWQLRQRAREAETLSRWFRLTDTEREALRQLDRRMPVGLTPYYASLIDDEDPACPIRKTKIPRLDELRLAPGEVSDPLGEDAHRPVPGVIHTYPDKALLLVTDFCATYCRYCTRGRMVGRGDYVPDAAVWDQALDYIARTPAIRDVLLTGGDPLILSDEKLASLLERLRTIPHVEFLRIGTKVPAVLPQRITPELVALLKQFHPLFMSLHFIHPRELTPEARAACERLADAGIPLGGQMVLLKGVNDDPAIMKALVLGQLRCRVKPYYLHQCDAIEGSEHFRTPVRKGIELLQALHGHTTGYAVPHFMIDAPGGGGKVPVSPDYLVRRDGPNLTLKNYRGEEYRYTEGHDPTDAIDA